MHTNYSLVIKSPAGITRANLDNPFYLSYRKEVNDPGVLVFAISPDHHAAQFLTLDSQIEVWRWDIDTNMAPYCDFYGFFRQEDFEIEEDGTERLIATCPGQMDYLERSIVGYKAGTANRTEFSSAKAETIMKTLVTRNATSSGTVADGRFRDVDAWGGFISVQADGANGDTVDFNCFGDNLLSALKRLALIGGGDFDLIKTGAQTWEFQWFTGQRGNDLSGSVIFSLERGNILSGGLTSNKMKEITVVTAGGQGIGSARDFETMTGANFDSTVNSRESFLNASQYSSSLGLQIAALIKLEETRAWHDFNFKIRQTKTHRYGRDYNVGDLVRGIHRGVDEVKQIWTVNVLFQDRPGATTSEQITINLTEA